MSQNITRVFRGGSWGNYARRCRSAYRFRLDDRAGDLGYRRNRLGFRVVSYAINTTRVIRGGSWCIFAGYCRSAYRIQDEPGDHNNFLGFRVLQTQQANKP